VSGGGVGAQGMVIKRANEKKGKVVESWNQMQTQKKLFFTSIFCTQLEAFWSKIVGDSGAVSTRDNKFNTYDP